MSPEQMQSSRDVDSRTDIWALGVILHELVTGGPPFVADTMPELVLRVVQGAPPASMRKQLPTLPEGFEAVVLRCLERDRARRYTSISELGSALLPFGPRRARASVERISGVLRAAGLSATALASPPPSNDEAEPHASATAASWGKTAGPTRRGSWLIAGVGSAMLVAGAAVWKLTHIQATAVPSAPVVMASPPLPKASHPAEQPPAALVAAPPLPPSSASSPPVTALPLPSTSLLTQAKGPPLAVARVRSAADVRANVVRTQPTATPEATPAPVAPPPPTLPPHPAESKPDIFDDRK
jgi:eukaryotic-like serine/threonine-protein kinase